MSTAPLNLGSSECKFSIVKNSSYLKIPDDVAKSFFCPSPRHVTMSTKDNAVWVSSLTHFRGSLFFGHTMCNFIRHYGISSGDILVFKFDKVSHLKVTLFHARGGLMHMPLETYPRFTVFHEPPKLVATSYEIRSVDQSGSDIEPDSDGEARSDFMASVIICDSGKGHYNLKDEVPTDLMTEAERKFTYKPFTPFCLIRIRRADMLDIPMLKLPTAFARSELADGSNDKTLMIYGKGSWPVKCYMFDAHAKIKDGWAKFTYDNWLLPGDACAFERSLADPDIWNVTMFKEHFPKGYI